MWSTHREGNQANDDNAQRIIKMTVGHACEHLSSDDAVQNEKALHGEHCQSARYDCAIVSVMRVNVGLVFRHS